MTPLQRLFGRDDKFYRLLDDSAAEARNGAAALVRLVGQLGKNSTDAILGEIDQSRRKHKRIGREITQALFSTFATPLEREDIEAISESLYKLSKSTEKIAERLLIGPEGISTEPIRKQITLLEQGVTIVTQLVGELQNKDHSESISDGFERIQAIEGEADRIMNELLRDLYHGQTEARLVVFWKDIYELIEKAIDRCRNVGGLLFEIVLKNS
jgi:hypothetical protein